MSKRRSFLFHSFRLDRPKASSMASLAPWLIQPYAEVGHGRQVKVANLLMQLGLASFKTVCFMYVHLMFKKIHIISYYHIHLSFHRFK